MSYPPSVHQEMRIATAGAALVFQRDKDPTNFLAEAVIWMELRAALIAAGYEAETFDLPGYLDVLTKNKAK